jgi:hypothetical protein
MTTTQQQQPKIGDRVRYVRMGADVTMNRSVWGVVVALVADCVAMRRESDGVSELVETRRLVAHAGTR